MNDAAVQRLDLIMAEVNAQKLISDYIFDKCKFMLTRILMSFFLCQTDGGAHELHSI